MPVSHWRATYTNHYGASGASCLEFLRQDWSFFFLWPEYASHKVLERLARLVHITLKFAKEVSDRSIPDGRIAANRTARQLKLLEVLSMTGRARFEGSRGAAIFLSLSSRGSALVHLRRCRLPAFNVLRAMSSPARND
jgi:hypothetical protein